jgi:hypothetical protein
VPPSARAIAAASRLTASTTKNHRGAVDLRDSFTDPHEYWLRLAWRSPLLGTEDEPDESPGCPDVDGVEWYLDDKLIGTASVPAWSPWDDWGGFIDGPSVDVTGEHEVKAVLIVGNKRAEVVGRFTPEPEPEPDARIAAITDAGATALAAELVVYALDHQVIATDKMATVLRGLRQLDPDELDPELFGQVAYVASQLRERLDRADEARAVASDRWAFAHGDADG